ncbi:Rhodanese-like protein [Basidiobolus meristosporus CBS 931.73]|uniref:Rhodanese-like protein n=1 Tax=Basidiobolus meristosporus CBS 931.73 TaxID=1314790 RepID=A0A1Y1ZC18_9FUNG|nr:Rhodanese-like protein [Basidiobolus meristosporus CBS 931.73]|eukprot:ORY07507.1 Rhodanese-like protein [Basidiobolus meristosporus CBS 931.73]
MTAPPKFLWPAEGNEVSYDEVQRLIAYPPEARDVTLIDVRGKEEFLQGSIPTSVNLPLDELENTVHLPAEDFFQTYQFEQPKPHSKIVLTCRSGRRSALAHQKLLEAGFVSVLNYPGSWIEFSSRLPAKA